MLFAPFSTQGTAQDPEDATAPLVVETNVHPVKEATSTVSAPSVKGRAEENGTSKMVSEEGLLVLKVVPGSDSKKFTGRCGRQSMPVKRCTSPKTMAKKRMVSNADDGAKKTNKPPPAKKKPARTNNNGSISPKEKAQTQEERFW